MRTHKKYFLIISIFFLCLDKKNEAQSKNGEMYPEIGKPCPNFILTDIEHFPKKTASLNNFRGKWLILDFWTRYCSVCVESMPKTDSLQKEFGKKVQFLLVGQNDNRHIKPL